MATTPIAVPELDFAVERARPLPFTAAPTLALDVRIRAAGGADVRSVLLDAQLQIAARRRAYDREEELRLWELFGAPADWGSTLRTLLWARTSVIVPPFSGATTVELPVPCTYDTAVAAAAYLDALRGGEVPLELLFSGTVFYAGAGGLLQAGRISWEQDAEYRLPVAVWRETMEHHFPGTGWLRLDRATLDRLHAFRARRRVGSWEATMDALLDAAEG